jgi:hypothetical protein
VLLSQARPILRAGNRVFLKVECVPVIRRFWKIAIPIILRPGANGVKMAAAEAVAGRTEYPNTAAIKVIKLIAAFGNLGFSLSHLPKSICTIPITP